MCETMNDELSNLVNNQAIVSDLNNGLILTFNVPNKKNKEAKFNLNLKKMTMPEEIANLNQLLNEHEKIIKEQNIKLSNQESEIKLLFFKNYEI